MGKLNPFSPKTTSFFTCTLTSLIPLHFEHRGLMAIKSVKQLEVQSKYSY